MMFIAIMNNANDWSRYLVSTCVCSHRKAPVRGESYLAMIEAAFECPDLPQDEDKRYETAGSLYMGYHVRL